MDQSQIIQLLTQHGFLFNETTGVWHQELAESIAYSDGDEAENRIAQIIAEADDVSLKSPQLRAAQTDWPSQYHLSIGRCNILRPLEKKIKSVTLEVGAGCGAITRYLGEQGGIVIALEGTARRAGIVKSRCRDLENVIVVNEQFENFQPDFKFDAITLIGVLEYARLFNNTPCPEQTILDHAFRLLKDDGVLIIAIENKLGLKYLAGLPEDHVGVAMHGVSGHYDQKTVATYGREELIKLLTKTGFDTASFYLPFPDYKFPKVILTPKGYSQINSNFIFSELVMQSVSAEQQAPYATTFSLEAAWEEICNNNLIDSLSNSFLIAANKNKQHSHDAILAEYYSTSRLPAFAKKITFSEENGKILTLSSELHPNESLQQITPLDFSIIPSSEYINAPLHITKLYKIVTKPNWTYNQFLLWFMVWFNCIKSDLKNKHQLDTLTKETIVPGYLLDALPQNLKIGENGEHIFFDLEWKWEKNITLGYLIFRVIKISLGGLSAVARTDDLRMLNIYLIIKEIFNTLHYNLSNDDLSLFLKQDSILSYLVYGIVISDSISDFKKINLRILPNIKEISLNWEGELQKILDNWVIDSEINQRQTEYLSVLNEDIAKIKKNNESLMAYTAELEQNNESLTTYAAELEQNNENLTTYTAELEQNNESLTTYTAELKQNNESLTTYTAELKQNNESLTTYTAELKQNNESLTTYIAELKQNNESLTTYTTQLEQNNESLTTYTAQLEQNNESLTTYTAHLKSDHVIQISSLMDGAYKLEQTIFHLEESLKIKQTQLDDIKNNINLIYLSRSWRFTAPLRFISRLVKKTLRYIYTHLPLPYTLKNSIKNEIYFLLTPFIKNTARYQRWQIYRRNLNAQYIPIPQIENIEHIEENEKRNNQDNAIDPIIINCKGERDYINQILSLSNSVDDNREYILSTVQNYPQKLASRLIAFYLPQYHPIAENNAWWGRGFTEWTNVSKAVPQFIGHYQPHLPGELGFYDLRLIDTVRRQAELAKLYGIEGFCFHYYWFDGKKLLDTPLENLYKSNIDLPFCLCWANENWTRRWDGLDNEILIAQNHTPEDDLAFIKSIEIYFKDSRYIRFNNKPVLIVYRPSLLPDAIKTLLRWREYCRSVGIGDLYLGMAQFDKLDPREYGFDFAVEFPPHKVALGLPSINDSIKIINPQYKGTIIDYDAVIARSSKEPPSPYPLIKTIFPGWDNDARKPGKGFTVANSSPLKYKAWLTSAINYAKEYPVEGESINFVNAWNEWAEGAHLEPDRKHGYAYLEATRNVLTNTNWFNKSLNSNKINIIIHAYYPEIIENILDYLKNWTVDFRLFISTDTKTKKNAIELILKKYSYQAAIYVFNNKGRDVLPFINILNIVKLNSSDIILKLHTKKSLHREDGNIWRNDMFDKLLSNSMDVKALSAFTKYKTLGLLAPNEHIVSMQSYWGANEKNVLSLVEKMKLPKMDYKYLFFAAGTMFYIRWDVLKCLLDLNLTEDDFDDELGQVDGTLAHAIERVISYIALTNNYYIASTQTPNLPFFHTVGDYIYAPPPPQ